MAKKKRSSKVKGLSRKFLIGRKLFGQHGMSDLFTLSLHAVWIQQVREMSRCKLSEIHHVERMLLILHL